MNWKTIFNPFGKFDDIHLLIVGTVFFTINFFGCFYSGMINDSIFHLSMLDDNQTIWDIVQVNSISYSLAIVILFVLAKFINRRARIIDIINTVLISQIPLIVTMPMMALPFYKEANTNITTNAGNVASLSVTDLAIVSIGACVTLPFLVYSFVLYYNGFKTATNIKKWQHIVAFVIVSFFITIVSQTIL